MEAPLRQERRHADTGVLMLPIPSFSTGVPMNRSQHSGFTLFQLLILLALFLILFALLLPAVAKVRSAAARAQSQNNLKQIAIAFHNYHDANGKFPAGVDANGFSASAYLLPYIEQQNVFQQVDFKKP